VIDSAPASGDNLFTFFGMFQIKQLSYTILVTHLIISSQRDVPEFRRNEAARP